MKFSKATAIAYLRRHQLAYSESTPARELIRQAAYHFNNQLSRWNDPNGCCEKTKQWFVLELASGNLTF